MKTLQGMKDDLKEFLEFDPKVMIATYAKDFDWGEEDYAADMEQASYLLEQVERRMKSLGRHLSSSKGKSEKDSSQSTAPEPESPE